MNKITRSSVGVIIVGSHVKKTTQQLQQLLELPEIVGVEVDVNQIKKNIEINNQSYKNEQLETALTQIHKIHTEGKIPVVYTSRKELQFADTVTRLAFGQAVSALLVEITQNLPPDIGFLISKGGITSNDTLSKALQLRSARLIGQVISGVSVITPTANHPKFPDLPVILFPGNVGNDSALALAYQRLTNITS